MSRADYGCTWLTPCIMLTHTIQKSILSPRLFGRGQITGPLSVTPKGAIEIISTTSFISLMIDVVKTSLSNQLCYHNKSYPMWLLSLNRHRTLSHKSTMNILNLISFDPMLIGHLRFNPTSRHDSQTVAWLYYPQPLSVVARKDSVILMVSLFILLLSYYISRKLWTLGMLLSY